MNLARKDFSALAQGPLQRSYNCSGNNSSPCAAPTAQRLCATWNHGHGFCVEAWFIFPPCSSLLSWCLGSRLQCKIRSGSLHRYNSRLSSSAVTQFLRPSHVLKPKSNKNISFPA